MGAASRLHEALVTRLLDASDLVLQTHTHPCTLHDRNEYRKRQRGTLMYPRVRVSV